MRPPVLAVAAAVVMAALFTLDALTGDDMVFVPGYVLGPLLVALAAGPGPTVGVGVLATLLGLAGLLQDDEFAAQDLIRLLTVAAGSALAVAISALRTRLAEALGLLDVVYAHAPVGIALLDRDLHLLRVNDRLAEIAGVPAAAHRGRTLDELLPDLPASVREDAARVVRTGTSLSEVEISGAERRWIASYWPVRRTPGGPPVGVGLVLADVTERRAAERALRAQTDRYEALLLALAEAGEGLLVLESDGRCVYANAAFEQLSGYTFPELAAMESVLELVGEVERIEGRIVPRTMRRRDGTWVDLEVGRTPLDIEGERQFVVVVRDVTARRRAAEERERLLARAALLAEASELFDRSLDQELTLRRVAQLCVRDIADTCLIALGDRGVVAAARDEARERELIATLEREPRLGGPIAEVMGGGAGQVAATPAGLGTARSVIVPLRARGRAHGVLVAGFDDLASAEDKEALALFQDLARRAALALDNARLYEERDHVARTLQRSLLPDALPDIPGVELAGRYVAAGEGNEVGGDFYDSFATGGGNWALVIGDVCGKGAEAATLTALARYTLRAAAQHTQHPQEALLELNEALLRQQLGYRFCTVLYASLTPREGRVEVRLATGGHPLPWVLRASGEVETAGSPGSLLGILDDPEISEHAFEIGPGDALVLVTDGVTEATAADRATGPGRLAALLADHAGADAAAIAEAVERDALESQGGAVRDDVAVLVARASSAAGSPLGERNGLGSDEPLERADHLPQRA